MDNSKDRQECYSVKEFAKRNGMSAPTVRRLLHEGKLPYFQPGGSKHLILIPHDALARCQPEYPALREKQNQLSDNTGRRLPGPRPRWMGWAIDAALH
jgi:excisionase family DNA binding protein